MMDLKMCTIKTLDEILQKLVATLTKTPDRKFLFWIKKCILIKVCNINTYLSKICIFK